MNVKKVLVIGDSLSYNSSDFDPTPHMNACDCFPDMGSWSFCLRDALMRSAAGFAFGADTAAPQTAFPHTVFGDRALCGLAGAQFSYRQKTDAITLYLQKHPAGGLYRAEIDGGFSARSVDFKGDENDFQARAVFAVTLPADPARDAHTVTLAGEGPFTLLGVARECKMAHINGRGSQTVRFFADHFDERVKKYEFDTLLAVLGANDVKHTPLAAFEADCVRFIEKIRAQNGDAQIVWILPPDMSDPDDPASNRAAYCSKETAAPYLDVLRKLAEKYRFRTFDTWKLFANIPIPVWRYDDVHFNKYGSRLLFEKLWEEIGEVPSV